MFFDEDMGMNGSDASAPATDMPADDMAAPAEDAGADSGENHEEAPADHEAAM